VLHKKVYVTAAKLRILRCLGFPEEDMQWFTLNEQESHIHVVPMWTIASFKRLKHISNQYVVRIARLLPLSFKIWIQICTHIHI
jgi:DNA cross-link repair 1A protein